MTARYPNPEAFEDVCEALVPFASPEDCMLLKYGRCRTRRCLIEAGWFIGSNIDNGECDHSRAAAALSRARNEKETG